MRLRSGLKVRLTEQGVAVMHATADKLWGPCKGVVLKVKAGDVGVVLPRQENDLFECRFENGSM